MKEKDIKCSENLFSMAQLNVLRQRGEICFKLITLAVNHCVALLRYVLRGVA